MSYRHQNSQNAAHHMQGGTLLRPSSYDVLGVLPTATDADIKLAYRLLVLKWHPDRKIHDQDGVQDLAEHNLKVINEAYSKIKTRSARDQYNQILRLQQKAMALSQNVPRKNVWGRFWNWLTLLESSRK